MTEAVHPQPEEEPAPGVSAPDTQPPAPEAGAERSAEDLGKELAERTEDLFARAHAAADYALDDAGYGYQLGFRAEEGPAKQPAEYLLAGERLPIVAQRGSTAQAVRWVVPGVGEAPATPTGSYKFSAIEKPPGSAVKDKPLAFLDSRHGDSVLREHGLQGNLTRPASWAGEYLSTIEQYIAAAEERQRQAEARQKVAEA
jgi:hypothetical protein